MITAQEMQKQYDTKVLAVNEAYIEACEGALDVIQRELFRNIKYEIEIPQPYAEFHWESGEFKTVFSTLPMDLTADYPSKYFPFVLTRIGEILEDMLRKKGFKVEMGIGYLKVSYLTS